MNDDKKRDSTQRDRDIVNSEIAIRRAAKRARQLAKEKGAYVVIVRDGKIVEEKV